MLTFVQLVLWVFVLSGSGPAENGSAALGVNLGKKAALDENHTQIPSSFQVSGLHFVEVKHMSCSDCSTHPDQRERNEALQHKLREAAWALSFCDAHPEIEDWYPGTSARLEIAVLKIRAKLNNEGRRS